MADGSAFYTKNGVYLGTAFRSIPMNTRLYPCIGLRTPGERVHVNFGKEPFVFDIIHYTMASHLNIYKKYTVLGWC